MSKKSSINEDNPDQHYQLEEKKPSMMSLYLVDPSSAPALGQSPSQKHSGKKDKRVTVPTKNSMSFRKKINKDMDDSLIKKKVSKRAS